MHSDQLRRLFLSYFEGKGHRVMPSSPLVPHGDPTLLFTSAGMVQFKPYFLGETAPPHPRLTSCQKCFRTSDIESVGDTKHLTFFEMLGNFSIGDYFKQEAIAWAWEFVTRHLGLPPERLWATIYLDDEEAFGFWREVGVPEQRIRRFGEEDNYWGPAGDTGPCGPCSEIHYDFGEEYGCGQPSCGPNCDCSRFLEIWNLVFMQFNQDREGRRPPLPRPNIDTGMGLERIAAVMQGKVDVYETDLFAPIIARVGQLCGKSYGVTESDDRALRVIAEHGRGLAFLIADGVVPENEGRGYVLRRILRRAALFGRKLGLSEPFLGEVAEAVIALMSPQYPELERGRELILRVITQEEERFERTLDTGLELLEEAIRLRIDMAAPVVQQIRRDIATMHAQGAAVMAESYGGQLAQEAVMKGRKGIQAIAVQQAVLAVNSAIDALTTKLRGFPALSPAPRDKINPFIASVEQSVNVISASEVFELYDTYGFPPELTQEVAREHGLEVDMAGFEAEMERQRERARAAWRGEGDRPRGAYERLNIKATTFVGYETLRHPSVVAGLLVNGQPVQRAGAGEEVEVVLAETPFYGEMGGQVGDTGTIHSPRGRVVVGQTVHPLAELIVHQGRVAEGEIALGEEVEAEVDGERRGDIARNHTATHLLQAALRQVVGEHIYQRGSLVAPDRFRFDFSHFSPLTPEELSRVQQMVNQKIRLNLAVSPQVVPYKEAMERGAIALFGEKYGEMVRLVEIDGFSAELCAGTHTHSTGEIGYFHILSEASIGAGLRRIEAVTGRGAAEFVAGRLSLLEAAAGELGTLPPTLPAKLRELREELERERRRARGLERELLKQRAESLLAAAQLENGVKVVAARVQVSGMEMLREMGDMLRSKLGSGVVVLGAVLEDRPSFLAMVTPDLVARGLNAGEIVRQVARVTGGGGGGRADMAQAGGKDKSKLDEALRQARGLVGGRG